MYPLNFISEDALSDCGDCQIEVVNTDYTAHVHAYGDLGESAQEHTDVPERMVHFLPVNDDSDLCKRLDSDFSFDDPYEIQKRSRSHSNPAHMFRKQSAGNNYSLTYTRSPPTNGHDLEMDHYGVSPHTSHHTLQQFKCYNIRLKRGVRLSNSAPNLPSMLSLHSAVL